MESFSNKKSCTKLYICICALKNFVSKEPLCVKARIIMTLELERRRLVSFARQSFAKKCYCRRRALLYKYEFVLLRDLREGEENF